MKLFAYIFCFYLTALMALPSVRVLKMQWNESCISSCTKSDFDTDKNCEKGKIIMSLNFTPVSYITTKIYSATPQNFIITSKREKIFYHKNLLSNYQNTIWQPPKIIS
jgi:hypothetical protein